MCKANKGEWSEFYAFSKILFDHKPSSSDKTYTISPESFLNVLSVSRKEDDSSSKYEINTEKQEMVVYKNDTFIISLPIMKIGNKLACILEKTKKGGTKRGSFPFQEDDELACYHVYKRDGFKKYLFENTKLEISGRSRHDFGIVYEENGYKFIKKLNLQIRFVN